MIDQINYLLILTAAFLATASPGPSTLAIAGTAMAHGRSQALSLAAGIVAGSWAWSSAAALGLGAVMHANAWVFELLRYLGAAYLMYLAFRSARSALTPARSMLLPVNAASRRVAFGKGLAMHLTNPKAIIFFGALYSVGVPADAAPWQIASVVLLVGAMSLTVFFFYALLFSGPKVVAVYLRMRRWFEGAFAIAFGYASLKVLNARLG